MVLKFLKNTVQRLLALAAGVLLVAVCGYFFYDYIVHLEDRVKILPALFIGGILFGIGLLYYAITGKFAGDKKATEEPAGNSGDTSLKASETVKQEIN
jgi:hypothetical protein